MLGGRVQQLVQGHQGGLVVDACMGGPPRSAGLHLHGMQQCRPSGTGRSRPLMTVGRRRPVRVSPCGRRPAGHAFFMKAGLSPPPAPALLCPARPPGFSCRGRSGVTPEAKHRMTVMLEAWQTCSRRSGAGGRGEGELRWGGKGA